jgi:catechol 2,3-dioxygenase-like lactoylglutathione lyase family enzyme
VGATGINHVSISAKDLEESSRFYEEVFGMERIPSPDFARPVRWLRVGNVQLHLILDPDAVPRSGHLGLTIDDFDGAYDAVRARADATFGWSLVELPSGQVQLYFRDPAGNLIELNWPDVETLDRAKYPELTRLADQVPQSAEALRARLYLGSGDARAAENRTEARR